MIRTAELHRAAEQEGLRFDQAEKDYVILWLLSGLAHSGATEHGWVFKGGTCLRHRYYEGYRFSEDIDFSCRPGGDNLEASLRRSYGPINISGLRGGGGQTENKGSATQEEISPPAFLGAILLPFSDQLYRK
jgi:hypothetical protein